MDFARVLCAQGVELVSTGGTARTLRLAGLPVTELSEFTGFPEILDGRVKTLHPKVHGGLLYRRDLDEHEATAARHGIRAIDLVAVNLYPFEATVAKPGVSLQEVVENIDIGGPALLRSAAKNHEFVTVVTDPADYEPVARQIREQGNTTLELRRRLAAKAFARTAAYDAAIATHLPAFFASDEGGGGRSPAPPALLVQAPLVQPLRYGENPHQAAALYGRFDEYFQQLHGRELSYNNILDLTAAAALLSEFAGGPPTLAILKHTNPCGVGQAPTLREAWERAYATDRQAPFGGIIAVNQPLDAECAEAIAEIFSEVIVAPDFSPDARAILQRRKNLRLIRQVRDLRQAAGWEVRSVGADSHLWQQTDTQPVCPDDWKVVTRRAPTPGEWAALTFGWRVVKHVKSNAIVIASADRTLGVGAGQMSRVDACRIAIWKGHQAGTLPRSRLPVGMECVVCSDAFFPFPDGLLGAAEAGATAAVQPGGSVRDAEVIAAADERGMAMVFTGIRHFRH